MAGIYIHIPFCRQACTYCNFHFATSLRNMDELVDAIVAEIRLLATDHFFPSSLTISTIYFGGGTPSLLAASQLERILHTLKEYYFVEKDAEITLEANPDDITMVSLNAWKLIGINRLSVGIQSFQQETLQWMNRAHNANDAIECIDLIQKAGFINYSVDLIYGTPMLSNLIWKRDVDLLINKRVPHISCYALTVESKTPLDKSIRLGKSKPVDSELQADQFLLLMQWMRDGGYEHYEVSNYCLPGFRSRHNSSYWNQSTYIGLGPSAHSYNGIDRRWNISNNQTYIDAIKIGFLPFELEQLTEIQKLNEYLMISLRTSAGIDLNHLQVNFGREKERMVRSVSEHWISQGKMLLNNNCLQLTDNGMLYADGIAADLFFS